LKKWHRFFIFKKLMFQTTRKAFLMYFASEQYISFSKNSFKKFGIKMFEITKMVRSQSLQNYFFV
jgi:hypothetical protein